MQTFFDWTTVGLFLVIAGLFFYRNQHREENIFKYLVPSVGCATANWFGNNHYVAVAFFFIALVVAFIVWTATRPLQEELSGGKEP